MEKSVRMHDMMEKRDSQGLNTNTLNEYYTLRPIRLKGSSSEPERVGSWGELIAEGTAPTLACATWATTATAGPSCSEPQEVHSGFALAGKGTSGTIV